MRFLVGTYVDFDDCGFGIITDCINFPSGNGFLYTIQLYGDHGEKPYVRLSDSIRASKFVLDIQELFLV